MKVLLKAGAPINLVNKNNQTPLDIAKQQASGVMFNALSATHNAKVHSLLCLFENLNKKNNFLLLYLRIDNFQQP